MKKITMSLLAGAMAAGVWAQEVSKDPSLSGYIQVQNQWGEADASLKVGAPNDDPGESFNRLGIRRGRIKFTYETGLATGVFQLDITEKGVGVKDAYLKLNDGGAAAFTAGVFNRPFGHEIEYSSSQRESPERSTVFQTLFPGERDLGAMATLRTRDNAVWLDAGLFAGNGVGQENDNRRDFIAHLAATKAWESVSLAGGVSYYNGGGGREYFGADAQLALRRTKLNAEYLTGEHFGEDFTGGYVMAVQGLAKGPVSLAGKFDWFDLDGHGNVNTVGLGALCDFDPGMRLTAWYDVADTANKNVFTLRLQHKF